MIENQFVQVQEHQPLTVESYFDPVLERHYSKAESRPGQAGDNYYLAVGSYFALAQVRWTKVAERMFVRVLVYPH